MEGSAGSTADKKRNKLGYHRTSVACVHCRRRKIRCLQAVDSDRCENCIRLKKDCQFFPVDQQPPIDKKGRPLSKSEFASADGYLVSTPPLGSETMMEQKDYIQHPTMNPTPEISSFDSAVSLPGTAMSTYITDPILSGVAQPFEDRSMYNQQMPGIPLQSNMNSSHGGVWPQGLMSTTPLSAAPSITSNPNSTMPLGSPPLPGAAAFGTAQPWDSQQGGPMALAPTDVANAQYPSQYPPNVNLTSPGEMYPGPPMNSHVQSIPTSIPVSYSHQPPPGYLYGLVGQNQLVVGTNPEAATGYYQTSQLQYDELKQGDISLLPNQGQLLNQVMMQNHQKHG